MITLAKMTDAEPWPKLELILLRYRRARRLCLVPPSIFDTMWHSIPVKLHQGQFMLVSGQVVTRSFCIPNLVAPTAQLGPAVVAELTDGLVRSSRSARLSWTRGGQRRRPETAWQVPTSPWIFEKPKCAILGRFLLRWRWDSEVTGRRSRLVLALNTVSTGP